MGKAFIHGTAAVDRYIRISRKCLSFHRHVQLTEFYRIHPHLMSQLICCGLHSKNTLCGTIATISASCLHIGVNNIISKTVGFRMTIQRNGFMA